MQKKKENISGDPRLNAVKHGLTAQPAILPNEDPADFEALFDFWLAQYEIPNPDRSSTHSSKTPSGSIGNPNVPIVGTSNSSRKRRKT